VAKWIIPVGAYFPLSSVQHPIPKGLRLKARCWPLAYAGKLPET
jgi:hypothetical protein